MEIRPELQQSTINEESETVTFEQENSEEDWNHVNLSNSGLAVIPATLFSRFELTKLDLSENNLKSLPVDIANLKNLQSLNLSKNGFSCTSPDDFTVLPRQMRKLGFLRSLNISECNLQFIPATIWEITSLEILDISRNNIEILRPNVGNLNNLQRLNAQCTGLKTLPQEIIGCEKLETLLLYGNTIQALPNLLNNIPNLQYISLNLRHFTKNIDSNMETLIQSGQIISNHIPNVIFNLPSIKKIELECCKINNLKELRSNIVEELYLQGNFFNEISPTILNLDKLSLLDLSNNLLTSITDEITKLESLKCLLLHGNQLVSVSNRIFTMVSLESLDLSFNKLKEISFPVTKCNSSLKTLKMNNNEIEILPNNIINLESLQNLDATNNHITKLPSEISSMKNMKILHTYKGLQRIGLWLLNNPIESPPRNVWSTTNIERISEYFRKIQIEKLQRKSPIRIILLGDDNCQKQQFLNKFLNKYNSNSTCFISIDQWVSSNSVPFVLVNINCDPVYSLLWGKFIEDNCLIWLFIKNDDKDHIEKWLKFIIDFSKDCVIQLIRVNQDIQSVDSHSPDTDTTLIEDINNESNNDVNDMIFSLQEKYQNNYLKILSSGVEISMEESLIPFKESLEYLAIDESLFHMEHQSGMETDLNLIEMVCKSLPCIYRYKDELISQIKQDVFLTTEQICDYLKVLHKKGKILWFFKSQKLNDKVYPFISVFDKAICSLLRIDYEEELNYLSNYLLRAEGCINEDKIIDINRNFTYSGEICYPLYKILSFDLGKCKELKDFLIDTEVAWTVPISDQHEENVFNRPYVVFPQFNKEEFDKEYFLDNVFCEKENVTIDCAISIISESESDVCDLFVNICCAINIWAVRKFDWKNVVYVLHNDGDVTIFKEFSERSQLKIGVIARKWADSELHLLPYDGNFRHWIENWYITESENRNNFSFKIIENHFKEFNKYFSKHLNKNSI